MWFNDVRKVRDALIVYKVLPGCVVGKEILRIRYESWQIQTLFKRQFSKWYLPENHHRVQEHFFLQNIYH